RQLVDFILELRRYVSETSRSAESNGARFAEIIHDDQRHVLLQLTSSLHVLPRIDHRLRYEFGHCADHRLDARNLLDPFGDKVSHAVYIAVSAVIDDKDLHASVSFPLRRFAAYHSLRIHWP